MKIQPLFKGCFYFEKGVSVVYYGEEIGMLDADISYENTMDPWGCNCGPINYVNCSRDPARTPMQWNGAKNAGFSQVRFIKSYQVAPVVSTRILTGVLPKILIGNLYVI